MEMFESSLPVKNFPERESYSEDSSSRENSIIEVPEELSKAIQDFSIAFLVDQPQNVVDYAVSYFTSLQNQRAKVRTRTTSSSTSRSNAGRLTFDRGPSYVRSSEFRVVEQRASIRSLIETRPFYHHVFELEPRVSAVRKSGERKVSIGRFSTADVKSETYEQKVLNRRDSGRKSKELARWRYSNSDRLSNTITISHFWYQEEELPRRKSTFLESLNPEDIEDVEILPKSTRLRKRLRHAIKNVLIFHSLDSHQMRTLLDSMTKKYVYAGEVVTMQGEPATELYVIDYGIFNVYRDYELVFTFYHHGVFGELALMSTKKRMATIIAQTDGLLWFTNRHTFRSILLKKAYHKRKFYEQQLRKVYMLQILSKFDLMKLADALQEQTFKRGDVIYKQGDKPVGMYLVVEGIVQIRVKDKNGVEVDFQQIGESTNFFGELSLLKTENQNPVSAYAVSRNTMLAILTIESFERIVGDSVEIVKRSIGESHPHYASLASLYRELHIDYKMF